MIKLGTNATKTKRFSSTNLLVENYASFRHLLEFYTRWPEIHVREATSEANGCHSNEEINLMSIADEFIW